MSARAEFVALPSKRFVTFDDIADLDLSAITAGDIVRLRPTLSQAEALEFDHQSLVRALLAAGASRVSWKPHIIREARARAEQIDEQLTALEALAAYIGAQEIDPDTGLAMLSKLEEWLAA